MPNKGRGYNPRSRVAPPNIESKPVETEVEMQQKIEEEFEMAKAAAQLDDVPVMSPKETKVIENVEIKREETQSTKPTYNFSKDQQGKVQIESKVVVETKKKVQDKQVIIKEMLATIDKEILKCEIEIEVHQELVKVASGPEHSYPLRIENFHRNIDYLTRKKNILEKMLKS